MSVFEAKERGAGVVIARLQGGLGNQLFQYAAARALADRLGRGLWLDTRDLDRTPPGLTPRPYLLDRYSLRASRVPAWRLFWRGLPRTRRARRLSALCGVFRGALLVERGSRYRPALDDEARRRAFCYMDGYWQSWRYFEGSRRVLADELRPLRPLKPANAALLARIARERSVCVHVRRGDYVSLPSAAAVHGLMGQDYYGAALKRLGAAARGAAYYVFSDEPDWARRHLRLPGKKTVVDGNADAPEEDLRLMSACRHFIIANSSFSWWGAWLGGAKGKRVVAPARWFKAGPDMPELCPPEWIRL